MQAVTDGRVCIGYLLLRGREGVEAFKASDRSLGVFTNMRETSDAIAAAEAKP